jgi:predicted nucleic acid-binding protein
MQQNEIMKKDIFIDTNIAGKFANPQDKEYIKLTKWLIHYVPKDSENKDEYAHLVVSNKLLKEYYRSSMNAQSSTAIPAIIDQLTRDGRLIIIKNDRIKEFKDKYYTKAVKKRLRCNNEDREHFPLVLLSDRKYALSYDDNFIYDLEHFPGGFHVLVKKRPEELPYL